MPGNYKWRCQPATRKKKKGRAIGGIIVGVRQNMEEEEGQEEDMAEGLMETDITVDKEKWKIITVYSKDIKKTKENLEKKTEDYLGNVLIGGDVNARIGENGARQEQSERGQEKRMTKDKTQNKDGAILCNMVTEKGWDILNGNKNGDESGEFTYIDTKGTSTIDYAIANEKAWQKIRKFKVGERVESDHMPIEVEICTTKEKRNNEERKDRRKYEKTIWSEDAIEKFKQKMDESNFTAKGAERILEEMEEHIKTAVEKRMIKEIDKEKIKNVWWDKECVKVKREARKQLRKWREEKTTKENYMEAKKKYREICKEKKRQHQKKEETKIKNITTEKELWEYINRERRTIERPCEKIKMEEWMKHFINMLEGVDEERKEIINDEPKQRNVEKITKEELKNALAKIKKGKAPGTNGIQNEVWMNGTERMHERLLEAMNEVWKGEGFPRKWREGIIYPIYKKGDKQNTENYRGISLLNTDHKLYAMILKERLMKEVEEKGLLPEGQAGFRKGRGTMDNVYILEHIVRKQLDKKGGKVYAVFIDLKAAFDSVNRKKLWECMRRKGVDENLIIGMEEIYVETRSRVRVGDRESKSFVTKKGVRQGCPLSSALFTIYIGDIEEMFERGQEAGMVVGKEKVWSLAYADDLVMLATDERSMKGMIKKLEKYMRRKDLEVNVDKTKIMVFSKGGKRKKEDEWYWEKQKIERVKEFKYLGYVFNERNNIKAHVKELERKANKVVGIVWGIGERVFGYNFRRRMLMFDSLVKSVMMYGAEIWGWKERDELERVQEKYLRWVLGVDKETPGYIIRDETRRKKIRVEAGMKAVNFEEKLYYERKDCKILIECLKEKNKKEVNEVKKDREKYYERCGHAVSEIERMREEGRRMANELSERDMDVELQEREERIRESRYNSEYMRIRANEIPKYHERESKREKRMIARFRCGNEEKENKFWMSDDERVCRMCGEGKETIEHMLRECNELRNESYKRETVLNEDGRGIDWMKKVIEARKRINGKK